MSARDRLRRRAGALVHDGFFRALGALGRLHPDAGPTRRRREGIEVLRDLPYRQTGLSAHRLDVYRAIDGGGPRPVVLYVHGGGFRILSKESHWIMAIGFARAGYVVCNISYRLAPSHPFPAAIEDCAAAYRWVAESVETHGGDPTRLVLAGESAGANLVTALAVAACYRRSEPFARAVFDTGVVPRAVVAACGMLQVSDPGRFGRRRRLPTWVVDLLAETSDSYLRDVAIDPTLDFADPLVLLERGAPPDRPLPAFFAPVGTRDPLLDDTRRLARAIDRLGAVCEARYYPGEVHAFHALTFRKQARRCWHDTFEFLGRHGGAVPRDGVSGAYRGT